MSIDHPVISPKKLIEVALPLDAINVAAQQEKAVPRHGHPQSLHYWWARRPLAAARAVIFSQLVHDPEDLWRCQNPGIEPNQQVKGHWTKTRARLFAILEDLVKWENTSNEAVLEKARVEIRNSWKETCELNKNHEKAKELFNPEQMPGLHDPFAGGGSIPLEAQRLGLDSIASDLNPVAVLINKAMIEIPPVFSCKPPVHVITQNAKSLIPNEWNGAAGLADDVRFYGQSVLDEAKENIGQYYPDVEITSEIVDGQPELRPLIGQSLKVIAWLWARSVKSPNPAFSHVEVPLASTFILGGKGARTSYIHPVIDQGGYHFTIRMGTPPDEVKKGTKAARGANFRCLMSQSPIEPHYIKSEATNGRMGQVMLAIVAQGRHGKVYLPPTTLQVEQALAAKPKDTSVVQVPIAKDPRPMTCLLYGMSRFDQLFTTRQLLSLTTFSELICRTRNRIHDDAVRMGLPDDSIPLEKGGKGASAYSEAVTVYLACALSRLASYNNAMCHWNIVGGSVAQIFSRQAIPISWDFIEINNMEKMSGNWMGGIEWVAEVIETFKSTKRGNVVQCDAAQQSLSHLNFISTDPPYYDNIGYADLADFFYVWLRQPLKAIFPELFATLVTPKTDELVVAGYRHRSNADAEAFFVNGMTRAMRNLASSSHPGAPVTIYYAFKQSETVGEGTNSTGWETFLEAVLQAGLAITGTWPIRTEKTGRMRSTGSNALASSIVLVCRPRKDDAGTISRRQFVRQLNEALPIALDAMTRESEGLHSPVAPVDLSQAIIGPGMAVFSKYNAVLEADGSSMSVKAALQLINRFLAEDDFDADTQFCLHWFEQYGWETSKFGEADTLARAKGTSVEGVKNAGVLHSGSGNVRLLKWGEYPRDWDPKSDQRLPIWEVLHQLIRVFNSDGESGAAAIFTSVQSKTEAARQLAYRLYTLCERKGWAEDARAYNEVVTSWSGIESAAAKEPGVTQRNLFDN